MKLYKADLSGNGKDWEFAGVDGFYGKWIRGDEIYIGIQANAEMELEEVNGVLRFKD